MTRSITPPLDSIGDTPLAEMVRLRPEGGGRILAKREGANRTGSLKEGKVHPGLAITSATAFTK